ncbi:MAG: peptide chain release factor N(5)-glutamine methyltransferase [Pirellulaceae bacterium]
MVETETQQWTIQRLLTWTTEYFQKSGRDSPRLAAEVLLAEALGCPRIQLYTRFAEVPVEPQLGKFRSWVKRHAAGEPVAYLVGHREFYSLRFEVNSDVLIPRPETEMAIVVAIDALRDPKWSAKKVIDVGTGSGCIAVTLAKQIPDASIVAIDISDAALAVAKRNAERHGVSDRIDFIKSDLLQGLPSNTQVPVIISNPPYVGRNEVGTLEENVQKYEPELALYGGELGTEITSRLIAEAAPRLLPDGWLILETSPMLARQVKDIVDQSGHYACCEIKKDLSKQERLVVARRKA